MGSPEGAAYLQHAVGIDGFDCFAFFADHPLSADGGSGEAAAHAYRRNPHHAHQHSGGAEHHRNPRHPRTVVAVEQHDGAPHERASADERPEARRACLHIHAICERREHQQGDAQRAGRQHCQTVARQQQAERACGTGYAHARQEKLKSEKPEGHQQKRIGDGRTCYCVEQLVECAEAGEADSGERLQLRLAVVVCGFCRLEAEVV